MADRQRIGSFNPVEGMTARELGWSQWWLDHRERVRKAGIGFLIGIDVLLLGIGAWGFTDWLAFGGLREEQAIREMTGAGYGRFEGIGLQDVRIGAPIVLPGGSGKIDILVPVENPNPRFWAELDYRLVIGGTALPLRVVSVLPGHSRYLAELGASTENGSSVDLKVEKRVWHHADTPADLDPQAFAETRLNIRSQNAVFTPSDPQATTPSSNAQFALVNDTAFGYYDVGLLVLLYRGDAIVGVNHASVDRLLPGERKPMQVFWYQPLPQVTKIEVLPEINIYDPAVYRAPT